MNLFRNTIKQHLKVGKDPQQVTTKQKQLRACTGQICSVCSYGAQTGKVILTFLGCNKLKATPEVKTTSSAGAKRCIDTSNSNYS
jgi:hypothetical protein